MPILFLSQSGGVRAKFRKSFPTKKSRKNKNTIYKKG
jgi:hypothetical protein